MFSYGPLHIDKQRQDDQLEPTYSSSVLIRDVALKTCWEQWTIEKGGEKGSGISMLMAWHDDDAISLTAIVSNFMYENVSSQLFKIGKCFHVLLFFKIFLFSIFFLFFCRYGLQNRKQYMIKRNKKIYLLSTRKNRSYMATGKIDLEALSLLVYIPVAFNLGTSDSFWIFYFFLQLPVVMWLQQFTSALTWLDRCLEWPDLINRLVLSNPSTYMIKSQLYSSNCFWGKQVPNLIYL